MTTPTPPSGEHHNGRDDAARHTGTPARLDQAMGTAAAGDPAEDHVDPDGAS